MDNPTYFCRRQIFFLKILFQTFQWTSFRIFFPLSFIVLVTDKIFRLNLISYITGRVSATIIVVDGCSEFLNRLEAVEFHIKRPCNALNTFLEENTSVMCLIIWFDFCIIIGNRCNYYWYFILQSKICFQNN